MMFLGEYRHTLDAKNRLFIPAKHREALGAAFYVTRKMEKCLGVYSEEQWSKMTEKLNTLPDSVVGPIKQFLFSKTICVSPDSQGRIVLPAELLRYAEIEKNAVIIGSGDHAQIWSDVLWDEKESQVDTAALMQQLREVGI